MTADARRGMLCRRGSSNVHCSPSICVCCRPEPANARHSADEDLSSLSDSQLEALAKQIQATQERRVHDQDELLQCILGMRHSTSGEQAHGRAAANRPCGPVPRWRVLLGACIAR